MAPHSRTLAWKIPWTEEPGRLQSMGLLRVRHDLATSLSLFTFMHWRRKWQPTPVFLPGESQGRGSLVGCRLSSSSKNVWDIKEKCAFWNGTETGWGLERKGGSGMEAGREGMEGGWKGDSVGREGGGRELGGRGRGGKND